MLEIYSFASNRPDLIEPQFESFERHLKEPFVFRVVNNAFWNDSEAWHRIELECHRLGLEVIDVPRDLTHAAHLGPNIFSNITGMYTSVGASCGYSVDITWSQIISHRDGKVLLCHHDMFLVEYCVLSDFIADKPLAFVPQDRPPHIDLSKGESECYLWEGFVLADIPKLPMPNSICWWGGEVNGAITDVGGRSYWWFKEYKVPYFRIVPLHVSENNIDYEYLVFNGRPLVLHYRKAAYDKTENLAAKNELLLKKL
jgi:hypothetical protein